MANPKEWGPALWTSLLYIVLSFPESPTIDIKNDYKTFFLSLGQVLPCMDCRKNYCDHLKVIPIDMYMDGQTALLNWLWRVHNQVNDFCGKTRKTLPEFLKAYLKPGDQNQISTLVSEQTGGGPVNQVNQINQRNQMIWLLLAILLAYWVMYKNR